MLPHPPSAENAPSRLPCPDPGEFPTVNLGHSHSQPCLRRPGGNFTMSLLCLLSGLLPLAAEAPGGQPRVVRAEFVFEKAPFASCHASTLAETRAGVVAAWFGGSREGGRDVGIWVSRHVGGRWTEPVEVATG